MRQLYKNDILRLAKDIKDVKSFSVYFLIYKDEVVYVGCSEIPYNRISTHIRNFNVDRYHILYFATKDEAFKTERYYIESFNPIQNGSYNDKRISKEEKMEINIEFHKIREQRKAKHIAKWAETEEQKAFKKSEKERRQKEAIEKKEAQKKAHKEQKIKEAAEAKIAIAERDKRQTEVFEVSKKVNIPTNTYVKKEDIYYFNIDNTIVSVKLGTESIMFQGKIYRHPQKVFGKISELL
jgi:hypothetical protein